MSIPDKAKMAMIVYKGLDGRVKTYNIRPIGIAWGRTAEYRNPQWLLQAVVVGSEETKEFSMALIQKWGG